MNKIISAEESNLRETFRKLGLASRPSQNFISSYFTDNNEIIKKIESTSKVKNDQRTIILSFFKSKFANDEGLIADYKFPIEYKYSDKKIQRAISVSCYRLTRALRKKEIFRLDKSPWITDSFSLYVLFVLDENARLGNNFKIRPNGKNIRYIASILIDKRNNLFRINNFSDKLLPFFMVLIQDELKTNFIKPSEVKVNSWKSISESILSNKNNLEIEEIALNKTDFATGDNIIIKAKKGDIKKYIESLLNQEDPQIISPDKFNISYIDYIKIRRPEGKTNFLNFEILKNGSIIIKNRSKYKDKELIKKLNELKIPIEKIIFDPKRVPKDKLMQQIIISGYLSKDEGRIKEYKDIISWLKSKHLIKKIEERYIYRCTRSPTCWAGSGFTTKKCPICNKSDKSKRFFKGNSVLLNQIEIKEAIKRFAKKNKFIYRRIKAPFYNKKYELQKLYKEGTPEINLYFNNEGLYKDVLNDFKKCPRPLLCINFRGEIKRLSYIYQIDASSFLQLLFNKDPNKLIGFLNNISNQSLLGEKIEEAFKESLSDLNKIRKGELILKSRKGQMYEWLTSNILNYLFAISDKWGGSNLPDGIIGILSNSQRKFIFWDAKCYDLTKLSSYSKKKNGVIKDLQYVLESLKQEDTYKEGKISYYLFLTSNTSKEDFKEVQKEIENIIEKNKTFLVLKKGRKRKSRKKNPFYDRLKEIKFCCINLNELIKLGDIFYNKENRDKLLRDRENFEIAFENLLTSDDGYLSSDRIDKEILPLLKKKLFIPQKEDHKRENLDLVK